MTPAPIIVTPAEAAGLAGQGGWTLWDSGLPAGTVAEVARLLGPDTRPAGGASEFNAIAGRIADAVTNMDRTLWPWRHRLLWHASDLAERNPTLSGFYFDCCRAISLREARSRSPRLAILVADAEDARRLRDFIPGAVLFAPPPRLDRLRRGLAFAGQVVSVRLKGLVRAWRQRRLLAGLRAGRPAAAGIDQARALFLVWANARSFDSAGLKTHDAYFGALPGQLRAAGCPLGFIGRPVSWVEPFDRIAAATVAAADGAMLEQELVPFGAVLRASLATLLFPLLVRGRFAVDGHDLSAVVRHHRLRDLACWRPTEALSLGAMARTLARRGAVAETVVLPYENQSWEKVLGVALRRAMPGLRVVGLQHAPFAERYLSFLPSHRDIAAGDIPDALVMIGQEYVERLAAAGVPAARLVEGGALRFPPLPPMVPGPARGRRSVLVACPMDYPQSRELLAKTWAALDGLADLSVVVNFHPTMGEDLRAALRSHRAVPAGLTVAYSTERAITLMRDAGVVLYNASGAGLEALTAGLPAIFVASDQGLDLDKLPDRVARRARATDEIRLLVEEALAGRWPAVDHMATARAIFGAPDWDKIVNVIDGREPSR